ncbi:hypothetical protein [Ruegeria sp. HKCCSP351]|uniref:hypothetical protein n=1 Tax=Ruegeria sp. HKCCSP351 TaxID=2794832 RepID=UPI001FD75041|nr:hypothetical protein [Ruegeria sp. HKCCSP351]
MIPAIGASKTGGVKSLSAKRKVNVLNPWAVAVLISNSAHMNNKTTRNKPAKPSNAYFLITRPWVIASAITAA